SAGTHPARTPQYGSAPRRRARGEQRPAFLLGLPALRPKEKDGQGLPAPRQASSPSLGYLRSKPVSGPLPQPRFAAQSACGSRRCRVAVLPHQAAPLGGGRSSPRFPLPASERTTPGTVPGSTLRNEQQEWTMSGYLNRASIIGNLGADPEARTTPNGQRIVSFSVATTETWKDAQSGEKRERTEWHRVVIFNEGLGKIAEKHLTKGAKVFVEGKLSTRKWQDQQGNDRYTTQIELSPYTGTLTFLDSRKNGGSGDGGSRDNGDTPPSADDLGEIPF